MKKLLTIIVLGLLWFAPVLADDYKWEISSMNEGAAADRPGLP